jgi:hypothetical protein
LFCLVFLIIASCTAQALIEDEAFSLQTPEYNTGIPIEVGKAFFR